MFWMMDSDALEGAFVSGSGGELEPVVPCVPVPEVLLAVVIYLTQELTLSLVVMRGIACRRSVCMTSAAFESPTCKMSVRLRTVRPDPRCRATSKHGCAVPTERPRRALVRCRARGVGIHGRAVPGCVPALPQNNPGCVRWRTDRGSPLLDLQLQANPPDPDS